MSRFVDAPTDGRCQFAITLRDHTTAQCGRLAKTDDGFCTQHARILDSRSAKYLAACPKLSADGEAGGQK